jgi:hypothetical protein
MGQIPSVIKCSQTRIKVKFSTNNQVKVGTFHPISYHQGTLDNTKYISTHCECMWGCFDNCVCVLVMCVLVLTVFCIVCTVFMFIYSHLFYLYYCKDYCHRVKTQLQ